MIPSEKPVVDPGAVSDFVRLLDPGAEGPRDPTLSQNMGTGRLDLDPENLKNGLGQLVLTLVKLLHELLERQAIRRLEAGSLDETEIERIGLTLMRQAQEIDRLRQEFNLEEDDLNLDFGPLGQLL